MVPTAACARASASSKSSMRCMRARSLRISRIAALETRGVSSAEQKTAIYKALAGCAGRANP